MATMCIVGDPSSMPGVQSKAIELTHLTLVAQDAKHCMAWGAIKLTSLPQEHRMHCISWGVIEGNRPPRGQALTLTVMNQNH